MITFISITKLHFALTFRVCLRTRARCCWVRMSWKSAIALLVGITVVLGTYLSFFERRPPSETLDANRHFGSFEKPSFLKKSDSGNKFFNSSREHLNHMNTSRRIINSNVSDQLGVTNFQKKGRNDSLDKPLSVNSSKEAEGKLHHGIKDFDWEGWVKENDFVNIGSFWGYCDDDDPIMVGKILLFDDSGYPSVTAVFNTTFVADITNGTAEGRIKYYDTEIYHKQYNLCELAAKYEDEFFECPILAGEKFYLKEKPVSRLILSGEYYVELSLRDEQDRTIICGTCKVVI